MKERTFLQTTGRGKDRFWTIVVQGNVATITWGQLHGSSQLTSQEFKALNVGKKNEKRPERVAREWAERQILLKRREGYREVNDKTFQFIDEEVSTKLNFSCLPENLRFYKPQHNLTAKIKKLIKAREAWFVRKRDGQAYTIVCDEFGDLEMYSRTGQPHHRNEEGRSWFARFPHLKDEIKDRLPRNTIITGEVCTTGKHSSWNAVDDLEYVGSVLQAHTAEAIKTQTDNMPLSFCVWDVPFWNGVNLLETVPVGERLMEYARLEVCFRTKFFQIPEIVKMHEGQGFHVVGTDWARNYKHIKSELSDYERIVKLAEKKRWEGYVVIDPNALYGEKAISYNGKHHRPVECCKLKPEFENDFIVRWDPDNGIGEHGKGKKKGGVGSVQAYLWDDTNKVEVPISKVGGALKDKDVRRFADTKLYPMVWRVKHSGWTVKNSLRYPKFGGERTDKTLEECTIDQIPS